MSDDHIEVEGEGDHLEIEASNTTEVNTNQDTIGVDDNDDLDEDDQGGDHIQVDEDDQQNDKKDDNEDESSDAKKEIYTFKAPWTIYGMGWSVQNSEDFRIAIGSFIEDYTNKVDVMELKDEEFVKVGSFDHPYPTTKIMWNPDKNGVDLIGTTGDYMRLWKVSEDGNIKKELVMNNVRKMTNWFPTPLFFWTFFLPLSTQTGAVFTTTTTPIGAENPRINKRKKPHVWGTRSVIHRLDVRSSTRYEITEWGIAGFGSFCFLGTLYCLSDYRAMDKIMFLICQQSDQRTGFPFPTSVSYLHRVFVCLKNVIECHPLMSFCSVCRTKIPTFVHR
eukprot:TRINITY_DN1334_c0_g1_i4.p1 TRINITY_DN1334_c0_g1~~TRINITY_DN1334_c0_g1_i4.p1  ORF type:complete len:341 (+),score=71.07 TRINITY_DN1334_c0_g1_i4:27-1025(+)